MMTAPLILKDPAHPRRAEQDVVMLLNDFTVRDPMDILAELQGQTPKAGAGGTMTMQMPGGAGQAMSGMAMGGKTPSMDKADLSDVKYEALLSNRRTLADPEVVCVRPGQTIRLRLIAASSATHFFIDTGTLDAQAIAVDGEAIAPFAGRRFELALAQRLDLRLNIPAGEAAYPILAQGEGTNLRTGLVLATPKTAIPALSLRAETAAGMMTVLKYQGFGDPNYNPLASRAEFAP